MQCADRLGHAGPEAWMFRHSPEDRVFVNLMSRNSIEAWRRQMCYRWHKVKRWLQIGLARLLSSLCALPVNGLESLTNPQVSVKPPIMDDIALPPYFGNDDHDDYTPLMKLAQGRQPKIILELGTAHGNTVANLCRHCPGAKIYTVNAPADEMTGDVITFSLGSEEIGRVYRAHGYGERVTQIFQNTLELDLTRWLPAGSVDLAIIDACHDVRYVLNDFRKVRPYMATGGLVLFHDTHPSLAKHTVSSYLATLLLRLRGYDVRHIRDTWWGFWINDQKH